MENFQRLLKFVILLLILSSYLINNVNSWNLSSVFGSNSSNIPITHITILKNKAYVSIPRISDAQEATFLQLPWPENLQKDDTNVNIYPRKDLQVIGECNGLQSVVCSDVDTSGRLYILDAGYADCPPKIVVYEGVGFKKVIGTIIELFDVNGSNLNSIIIDPFGVGGPRAYIGDTSDEIIIVYSFRDEHWWPVKLLHPADSDNFLKNHFKIQPQQFALSKNKPILYFTSNNSEYLFSVNAVHLRTMLTPPEELCDNISIESEKIQVTYLGEKLGPSNGLTTDGRFGLYYYIPRDYVVVRWDTRYLLIAENHEVLTQSAEILPTVEQLFYDNQNILWALLGLPNSDGNHCTKIQIK